MVGRKLSAPVRIGVLAWIVLTLSSPARAQFSLDPITAEGLGYPVPRKIDSLTPVEGFRSRESIVARLEQLWLDSDVIERLVVGRSIEAQDLVAYAFSSPGDLTPSGQMKSAAVLIGGLHAREWISPEVVTAIFEWLALSGDSDPVVDYLLDHVRIVIHPLANPDGLLHTEHHADRTLGGGPTGWSGVSGRMHRKNMRDVDPDLATLEGARAGVDLNRNHRVGFGSDFDTTLPASETYGGPEPESEPETLAVLKVADFARIGNLDRLRLAIDYHSFGQFYYVVQEAGAGRNDALDELHATMSRASEARSGRGYDSLPFDVLSESIGATDEYFGFTHGCASFTCEIAPSDRDRPVNGFVLPESDVDSVRKEHVEAARAALLAQSGPAVLEEVTVLPADVLSRPGRAPLARFFRLPTPGEALREQSAWQEHPLVPGEEILIVLRFNQPMRRVDEEGQIGGLPGQPEPRTRIELGDGNPAGDIRWVHDVQGGTLGYRRYPGDTLLVRLSPVSSGGDACSSTVPLTVEVDDLLGRGLDADPLTIADWTRDGWVGYEDSTGQDGFRGGADTATGVLVLSRTPGDCALGEFDCDGDCLPDDCALAAGLVPDEDGDGNPDTCTGRQRPGDCNQDTLLDLSDVLCVLGHLFLGNPSRLPCHASEDVSLAGVILLDMQGDGRIDLSDPVGMLGHLFLSGPPPVLGVECTGIPGCPDVCGVPGR